MDCVQGDREAAVAQACAVITAGGIVAFPTETFYGLGVRYDREESLKRLYAVKRRPSDRAIPLIIGGIAMLSMVADEVNPLALRVAESFWPGPLTMLLAARSGLSPLITAGTGKVAVRIPGNSLALDVAQALPFPITATSANISGTPPAYRPGDVASYFGDAIDLLLDGGATPGGRPSTIIEIVSGKARVLREGIIPFEQISRVVGTFSGK